MATNPGAFSWSAAPGDNVPPWQQLWQVPAFFVGLAALVLLCVFRPPWGDAAARQADHDLAEARRLLAEPQPELDHVKALAEGVLGQPSLAPRRAALAHFLVGCATLTLADKSTGAGAVELYQLARTHLTEAEALGVADEDRPRLRYRLGKIAFHLHEDPKHTCEYLADSIEAGANDPAEGYMMLAQCYLRLAPPNLPAAREAVDHVLALPIDKEEVLGPARLLRGELALVMKDNAVARQMLESVRAPAAPAVLSRAHRLLARSYQDEARWSDAAALWKELAAHPDTPVDRFHALCELGTCYRHLDQPDEAIRAWEQVMAQAGPEEAQAAALGLGEVRLARDPDRALGDFERALKDVRAEADWKNSIVELKDAQRQFEAAWRQCRQTGRYETALRLATLYERLAPPGQAPYLWAQAAEEWAQHRLPQAHAGEEERSVRDLFRQAGTHYEAAAVGAQEERAKRLWQAVVCDLEGRDTTAVPRVLELLAKTGQLRERVGEGWYRLGLTLQMLADGRTSEEAKAQEDAAYSAYTECLNFPGKFAYRARYERAVQMIHKGNTDGAQKELLENQTLLAVDPDPEAHEKTLFALARLLYQHELYIQAKSRLEDAIERYKDSPNALEARYELATCYYKLAERDLANIREASRLKPETEEFYRGQFLEYLGQAAQAYFAICEVISDRAQRRQLTEEEENLRRTVMFATADCRVQQGQYEGKDGALPLYVTLAGLYHNRVDRLHALAGKRQCYWLMAAQEKDAAKKGRYEEDARATLKEIARALEDLSTEAFRPEVSRMSRLQWQDWVDRETHNDDLKPLGPQFGKYAPADAPLKSDLDGR